MIFSCTIPLSPPNDTREQNTLLKKPPIFNAFQKVMRGDARDSAHAIVFGTMSSLRCCLACFDPKWSTWVWMPEFSVNALVFTPIYDASDHLSMHRDFRFVIYVKNNIKKAFIVLAMTCTVPQHIFRGQGLKSRLDQRSPPPAFPTPPLSGGSETGGLRKWLHRNFRIPQLKIIFTT